MLNAADEKELLLAMRALAADAPFANVTIFSPYFILFDQFVEIVPSTLQTVLICVAAMLAVSLLLIPEFVTAFVIVVVIFTILLGIGGFMVILEIDLDVISMISIIISIGFSVDFSAHIANHFIVAGADHTPNDRSAQAQRFLLYKGQILSMILPDCG